MADGCDLRVLLDGLDFGAVRELFGGTWHILQTEQGWWAFRRGGGVIYWDGPHSLIQHCVHAEHLGDLAGQLCLQEFFTAPSADELASVYAAGEIPSDLFPTR